MVVAALSQACEVATGIFLRTPADISMCLCAIKTDCFSRAVWLSPCVIVATKTGIMSQPMMFSEVLPRGVFVPKPNQSISSALGQQRNGKFNLKKKLEQSVLSPAVIALLSQRLFWRLGRENHPYCTVRTSFSGSGTVILACEFLPVTPMWVIRQICHPLCDSGVRPRSGVVMEQVENSKQITLIHWHALPVRAWQFFSTWCNPLLSFQNCASGPAVCRQRCVSDGRRGREPLMSEGRRGLDVGRYHARSVNTWGDKSGADTGRSKVCVCVDSKAREDLITKKQDLRTSFILVRLDTTLLCLAIFGNNTASGLRLWCFYNSL